jgi:hypothetical protein
MLIGSCTRRGFCDKVTPTKNNRKSPKKRHDAKWSESFKVCSDRKIGLSWQRVRSGSHKNAYVQVHRHNKKQTVGAPPLGDSNKQLRATIRHATSSRFPFVYGNRNALFGVGGSNPPYCRQVTCFSLQATGRGGCQGKASCLNQNSFLKGNQ